MPSPRFAVNSNLRSDMHETQFLLNALGYNAGPVDGVAGRKTYAAAAEFRSETGITKETKILDALNQVAAERNLFVGDGGEASCAEVRVTKKRVKKPTVTTTRAKKPDTPAPQQCSFPKIFNSATGQCIDLIGECPFGSIKNPLNGQCTQIIGKKVCEDGGVVVPCR